MDLDYNEDLEEKKIENQMRKEKATEIALRYNFVTDLTSLVVVKPKAEQLSRTDAEPENEESLVEPMQADKYKLLPITTTTTPTFSSPIGVSRSGH